MNAGADWTTLAIYTGTATNVWRREHITLAAYLTNTVLLRFRVTTGVGARADGWHLDDISVVEAPAMVPAPVLDNVTSHSIRVTWAPNTNTSFAGYVIFRSTSPGAGVNSIVAATIADQGSTRFTDSNLALDTTYYYRVYAVNGYGTFSPDSPLDSSARTLNNPLPLADDFESGLANWNLTGSWGLSTNYTHGGNWSLTDSPQGNYVNGTDSAAQTSLNLAGTLWPVLRFWDRHQLADGDWGWAEVSPDGVTWTRVYGVAGIRSDWVEQSVDLSPWRNQANLRLRFHITSDGSGTEDGWYVDDLSVADHAPGQVGLPLAESFEGGVRNWLHAGWNCSTNAAYAGLASVRSTTGVRMPPETFDWLELDRELRLTNVMNPQLTFWLRGHLDSYSPFRAQVSGDGGLTWTDLSTVNADYGFNADWTRRQVSLQAYVNQVVRLRFQISAFWGTAPYNDLALDKITLAEMPAPAALQSLTPHLRSVEVAWSGSPLGGAFQRYEVYRATHSGVTTSDTLIGSLSNAAVTNLTDTGLSIGASYYYVVYTVDASDTYTPSNERSTTTVPVVAPLVDALGDTSQWVTTGTWGISPTGGRDGGPCLADSPSGDYTNSSDMYALTAVSLSGTAWPVLRFWDRHRLADGDWGWAEVSPDGTTWTRIYGAAGIQSDWTEQSIDLSPWRNQSNLRLRFPMTSDGSGTEDGWHVDDLSVADHAPGQVGLPLAEGFEAGVSNWLHAGWNCSTNAAYAGLASVRSTTGVRMPLETVDWLELDRELRLTNVMNPQLTFWLRGVWTATRHSGRKCLGMED